MRVLVTGATGVLGRRVVPLLVAHGHRVTAVARTDAKARRLREAGATPIAVDLLDRAAVHDAVVGHEAVVNLATSIPPASKAARRSAWDDNDRIRRDASRHLVDAALATAAGRFVQESITFPYVDGGSRWLDEATPFDAVGPVATAHVAERELGRFTRSGGNGVVLRFAQLVAPDSTHDRELLPLLRRGFLPLFGDHDGYESYVDADDAAAAVVAALDAPAGTYNVADDVPLTRTEHAAVVAEAIGRPVRLPPRIVGSIPALRVRARSQRVSNAALKLATGWRPDVASMREGWPALVSSLTREVHRVA